MADDGSQFLRIPPRLRDWEELNRRVSAQSADVYDRVESLESGGTTVNRPPNPRLYQPYFDTTLGRPVWWNGAGWVDATGAAA